MSASEDRAKERASGLRPSNPDRGGAVERRPRPGMARQPPVVGRRGADADAPLVIVADTEAGRAMPCKALRGAGFRVAEVDGAEALIGLLATRHPSAVVMELMLPDLNGVETAKFLSASRATSHVPLIAISTSWLAERQDLLQQAGFSGSIRKPFTAESLLAEVARVLGSTPVTATPAAGLS